MEERTLSVFGLAQPLKGVCIVARMYDMKQKEVINASDGIRFGFVSDVEIDTKTGKIKSFIVPAPGKVLGVFGRDQEYRIEWDEIKKIGEDIILVEVDTKDTLVDSE